MIRTPTRSCPRTGCGEYVTAAERAAVDEIGFTDHVFRFTVARDWLDHPLWTADGVNDLAAYHGCVSAARDAGMPVKVGLEVDYLDGREDAIRAALDPFEWDFLLGSVHWIDGLAVDWEAAPIWERHAEDDVWEMYVDALCAAAQSGIYDSMAHPDLVKVFGNRPDPQAACTCTSGSPTASRRRASAPRCRPAGSGGRWARSIPTPSCSPCSATRGVPVTLGSDAHGPGEVGGAVRRGAGGAPRRRLQLDHAVRPARARRRWRSRDRRPAGRRRVRRPCVRHGRRLVLAGVEIEHARGLVGHSDADLVAHAVTDALLGAAGREDIGHLFPSDDPALEGASSIDLLARVWAELAAAGWAIVNVDAIVIMQEPRIAPLPGGDARGAVGGARDGGRAGDGAGVDHRPAGVRRPRRGRRLPGGRAAAEARDLGVVSFDLDGTLWDFSPMMDGAHRRGDRLARGARARAGRAADRRARCTSSGGWPGCGTRARSRSCAASRCTTR